MMAFPRDQEDFHFLDTNRAQNTFAPVISRLYTPYFAPHRILLFPDHIEDLKCQPYDKRIARTVKTPKADLVPLPKPLRYKGGHSYGLYSLSNRSSLARKFKASTRTWRKWELVPKTPSILTTTLHLAFSELLNSNPAPKWSSSLTFPTMGLVMLLISNTVARCPALQSSFRPTPVPLTNR